MHKKSPREGIASWLHGRAWGQRLHPLAGLRSVRCYGLVTGGSGRQRAAPRGCPRSQAFIWSVGLTGLRWPTPLANTWGSSSGGTSGR